MDFFELNAFLTLSKTLHFAKTAEKINLSPSALSRLITRLEDETSCQLFERNNREATLTEKGKKLAEVNDGIKHTLDFLHSLEDNKENNAYIKTAIRWVMNSRCGAGLAKQACGADPAPWGSGYFTIIFFLPLM